MQKIIFCVLRLDLPTKIVMFHFSLGEICTFHNTQKSFFLKMHNILHRRELYSTILNKDESPFQPPNRFSYIKIGFNFAMELRIYYQLSRFHIDTIEMSYTSATSRRMRLKRNKAFSSSLLTTSSLSCFLPQQPFWKLLTA